MAPTTRREIEEDATLALNFLSGPIRCFFNATASELVPKLHTSPPRRTPQHLFQIRRNSSVPDENPQSNKVPEQPAPAEGGADKVAPAADKVSVPAAPAENNVPCQEISILGRASGG